MSTKIEPTIESLKDTFHLGYDLYETSRIEADEVWNMYHNRQWTEEQLNVLEARGQPKETFNVIKLFARTLVGYYSTVVNTAKALPTQANDVTTATLATDIIQATMEQNDFLTEGDKMKLSALVSGLMVVETHPIYTGKRDNFNRPIYKIKTKHVADYEVVIDPLSREEDYSDGRFLHRYKWVPAEEIQKKFGKAALDDLEAYYNHLEVPEAEFDYKYGSVYQGRYRVFDNFLLVHSVLEDVNGKRWSVHWCGDKILRKKEITYRNMRWPYRVIRMHTSDKAEYYGIFREVVESQKAINQAIVKLQLMVNSEKIFAEEGAISGTWNEFETAVNRVTGIIKVKKLSGVKVEQLSREALEQYAIVDKAFDRIQSILGVTDSFLGQAFASDSGRKVKLQQSATMMSLRYLTARIELIYKYIGQDILALASQYMYAEQSLRVTDEMTGYRFIQLNQPMTMFSGQFDAQGQPVMQPVYEQVKDPDTNKPLEDESGNYVFAPIPEEGTEVKFDELDITIESTAYNDEDEKAQLMMESVMSGQMGQMLAQINPAGYLQVSSLALKSMKTKYSPEISAIFEQTAQMLGGNPEAEREAQFTGQATSGAGTPGSRSLKLPQNTNEVASDHD